jgi:hypothetical protein
VNRPERSSHEISNNKTAFVSSPLADYFGDRATGKPHVVVLRSRATLQQGFRSATSSAPPPGFPSGKTDRLFLQVVLDLETTAHTPQLGNSSLRITPIGFGAWAIGGGGWEFAWITEIKGVSETAASVR